MAEIQCLSKIQSNDIINYITTNWSDRQIKEFIFDIDEKICRYEFTESLEQHFRLLLFHEGSRKK